MDVGVGVAVGVAVVGVAVGVGRGGVTGSRLVVIRALQVIVLPPGLPEPLHWRIVTGMAALTVEDVATSQTTLPPPPLPEPLHWVTVASEVVAGNGWQLIVPLPVAEPTH